VASGTRRVAALTGEGSLEKSRSDHQILKGMESLLSVPRHEVLAEFGRVPRSGETIDLHGYRLVVEQVIRRRVRRVAVYRPAVEAPLGGAERVLP